MNTIKLTSQQITTLRRLLSPRIIEAPHMLDKREIVPTYDEVMTLIEIANQLNA